MSASNFESVRVVDRPLAEGFYSWGWVDYSTVHSTASKGFQSGSPTITVAMFDEPYSLTVLRRLKRMLSPRHTFYRSLCFLPLLPALLSGVLLNMLPQELVGVIAFSSAFLAVVLFGRYLQDAKKLRGCTVVTGTSSLEDYVAGRDFLKALADPALTEDSLTAYFELRARAATLQKAISDAYY